MSRGNARSRAALGAALALVLGFATSCATESSKNECAPMESCEKVVEMALEATGIDIVEACSQWSTFTEERKSEAARELRASWSSDETMIFEDPNAAAGGVSRALIAYLDECSK